jgi:hypothetical protein
VKIKVPSAHVSATSGQGISRKAEQTARGLGFKGTGTPGGKSFKASVKISSPRSGVSKTPRDYAKVEPNLNVDYGETFNPPTDKDMWPGDDK